MVNSSVSPKRVQSPCFCQDLSPARKFLAHGLPVEVGKESYNDKIVVVVVVVVLVLLVVAVVVVVVVVVVIGGGVVVAVCLLVGCLTSQQHASVSQGRSSSRRRIMMILMIVMTTTTTTTPTTTTTTTLMITIIMITTTTTTATTAVAVPLHIAYSGHFRSQLDDLDIPDCLALLSQSQVQTQKKTTCLESTSARTGLHTNNGKTKTTRIQRASDSPVTEVGPPLEGSQLFYLCRKHVRECITNLILIAFQGTIRDFLQSPHCAANRLQHVRSSGPGAIVCKSRASTSNAYHVQHVVLSATWYEGTAQLLSLTEFKSLLF